MIEVENKSLLTPGHKQNTNFSLQRERPLYDPSTPQSAVINTAYNFD